MSILQSLQPDGVQLLVEYSYVIQAAKSKLIGGFPQDPMIYVKLVSDVTSF